MSIFFISKFALVERISLSYIFNSTFPSIFGKNTVNFVLFIYEGIRLYKPSLAINTITEFDVKCSPSISKTLPDWAKFDIFLESIIPLV